MRFSAGMRTEGLAACEREMNGSMRNPVLPDCIKKPAAPSQVRLRAAEPGVVSAIGVFGDIGVMLRPLPA